MRALILHNAVADDAGPDEQDVLVQVEAVGDALSRLGHGVEVLGCGLDLSALAARLRSDRPDVVFNLIESLDGEGRLIHVVPSLLDSLGVPYTGCPSEALFLTSHKILAKERLQSGGLPTPPWWVLHGGTLGGGPTPGEEHGRCLVKSVWEDASLGMDDDAVIAATPEGIVTALRARRGLRGAPWFAEAYIDGREFNLSVLDGPDGPTVLPVAEMVFVDYPADKPQIVNYAAKWDEDSFEYQHTVRGFTPGDDALAIRLTNLARECWHLFGLGGWARVDFRVDAAGEPWILEINANPCLSPDGGFQAALVERGLTFTDAVERILAAALDRGELPG